METLILSGLPRVGGNTGFLLEKVKQNLSGNVVEVDGYRRRIAPCVNCGYCKDHDTCIQRDDMSLVYNAIQSPDCSVLLASPVYFTELTGALFDIASRLEVYYYHNRVKSLPPKKGVILLTAGGDGGMGPALASARRILHAMNVTDIREVTSSRTDTLPAVRDEKAMHALRDAVLWMESPM